MLGLSRQRVGLVLFTLVMGLACSSTPSILTAEQTRRAAQSPQVPPTDTLRPTPYLPSGNTSPVPSATATHRRIGPSGFPADVDPLTGLQVQSPALLERRPVGLEYANFPVKIRPQSGLSMADLVFEHASGQGTTRLLAIFYGRNSASAGPITSAQWVNGELMRLYSGILGVNGAIPEVDQTLRRQLPGRIFLAGPALCPALCPRGQGSASAVFTDTAALSRYVNGLSNGGVKPDLTGYVFDAQPPSGGEAADKLRLDYAHLNEVGWDYDPEMGAYVRLQDQADGQLVPATDALTDEPLAFQNIMVLFARHDAVRPNLLDISLWFEPSRPMLLLRNGRLYRGTWSTSGLDSPLNFLDAEGFQLVLSPGSTWVEIVGLASAVTEPQPGSWQINFAR